MGYQVMMIRGTAASPVTTIAVSPFLVSGIVETLADDAPLDGKVAIAIDGQALIDTPTDGTVVDDNIVTATASQTVALMVGHFSVAQAETHVADDVVGTDHDGIVGQTDAVARSSLPGDSRMGCEAQGRLQEDGA